MKYWVFGRCFRCLIVRFFCLFGWFGPLVRWKLKGIWLGGRKEKLLGWRFLFVLRVLKNRGNRRIRCIGGNWYCAFGSFLCELLAEKWWSFRIRFLQLKGRVRFVWWILELGLPFFWRSGWFGGRRGSLLGRGRGGSWCIGCSSFGHLWWFWGVFRWFFWYRLFLLHFLVFRLVNSTLRFLIIRGFLPLFAPIWSNLLRLLPLPFLGRN